MKWLVAILLIPTIGWCQEKPDRTTFGFYTGSNIRSFSANLNRPASMDNLDFTPRVGVQLGTFLKMEAGANNAVVISLGLNTHRSQMTFDPVYQDLPTQNKKLESTMLSGQLSDRFTVHSREKMGVYVLGGISVNYLIDDSQKRYSASDLLIKTWSSYASLGFGCDINFAKFTMSPELRYEESISDLHRFAYTTPSTSITRLSSHTLFLSFFFS